MPPTRPRLPDHALQHLRKSLGRGIARAARHSSRTPARGKNSCDDFGATDPALFGVPIAIGGIAGDQQAALVGQACFQPGMIKSTYGTGCFIVLNTGATPVVSTNRLLTTIGYRLGGINTYALEGFDFCGWRGGAMDARRDGHH